MKKGITVEYYELFKEFKGICYKNEDYNTPLEFRVSAEALESWLTEEGLIGLVSVDSLDGHGEHSVYESNVTFREYLCESFDEITLAQYLGNHQDSILSHV